MEIAVITGSSAPEKSKPPSIISDDHIRKRRLYPRPGRFRCTDSDLGQTRPRFGSQNLKTHQPGVMGLGDNFIRLDDSIDLPMTIGSGKTRKTIMAEFVVLQDSTA
ncbi:hypothetical protein PIB30_113398 [Stylosanthes scabra]|uniref:Uncharacterized protein n=1 Tax=Stylosanthes scabra TaxID=79078 RepID=A0ABU6X1F2_9FABA|nr:hypothetical protein [Stylosanthes scabra]